MVYIVAIDDDVVVRLENDQASFYCVFCFKLLSNLSVCMAVCVCVCVCVCAWLCACGFFFTTAASADTSTSLPLPTGGLQLQFCF